MCRRHICTWVFLMLSLFSIQAHSAPSVIDLTPYQQVRYVSVSTGSDATGDGSQSKPWQSLNYALSKITDAAQNKRYALLLASGTYTNTGSGGFGLKPWLDIYGGFEPVNWTRDIEANPSILDGENLRPVVQVTDHLILDGITVRGGKGGGLFAFEVEFLTIRNCIIENNSHENGGGIYIGGPVMGGQAKTMDVQNCIIRNNSSKEDGGGIYIYYDYGSTISNCIITGNYAGRRGAGIFMEHSNFPLSYNTIADNYGSGVDCQDSVPEILNCILWNYGPELTGGAPSVSHSCVQGGWEGEGNHQAIPRFADPSQGDYHLMDGSPCIGAASQTASITVDMAGNPRPQGGSPEMGAYEMPAAYVSGSTATALAHRYVKWDAPHGGDGLSWATAQNSIEEALSLGSGGDEIWVSAGTYHESVMLERNTSIYGGFTGTESSLSERSLAGQPSIIDASGLNHSAVIAATGCLLDGFTITQAVAEFGAGVRFIEADCRMSNLSILRNSPTRSGAIYIEDSSPTLVNLLVAENNAGLNQGAAFSGLNASPKLVYCTVANNLGSLGNALSFEGDSHPRILNSIFANIGTEIAGEDVEINYSCLGGWSGEGNVDAPPLFVDSLNGDYRLANGSPCIGRATATAEASSDIDGLLRPQGAASDMGAFEAPAEYVPGGAVHVPRVFHVVAGASPEGDGSSWTAPLNSITRAMSQAWSGDEIWVASGTYPEAVIQEASTSLYGGFGGYETMLAERNWKANPTIIDATGLYMPALIAANLSRLDGLVITHGEQGGAICLGVTAHIANCVLRENSGGDPWGGAVYCDYASALIENCSMTDNSHTYIGGGINAHHSDLQVSGCAIDDNTVTVRGGGLYLSFCDATFTNCSVSRNSALSTRGGGVVSIYSSLRMQDSHIERNLATTQGGGLYGHESDFVFNNVDINDNQSKFDGSGIYAYRTQIHLSDSRVMRNQGPLSDGAIYFNDSTVTITNTTLSENSASGIKFQPSSISLSGCNISQNGRHGIEGQYASDPISVTGCNFISNAKSGLYLIYSDIAIHGTTIAGNKDGGAYLSNADVEVYDSLISGNTSTNFGGIQASSRNSLIMERCVVENNKSQNTGGGIRCGNKNMTLNACRISRNNATDKGGGISCGGSPSGSVLIKNSLIDANYSKTGGGIYMSSPYPFNLINTTLANNTSQSAGIHFYANHQFTALNSIFWNNSPTEFVFGGTGTPNIQYSDLSAAFPGAGNLSVDPLFVDAAHGDFHLSAESPLIDKGIGPEANPIVPLVDLEGDARSGLTCDIGADEHLSPTFIQAWENY